jgi:RHS repeat-associated protein
LQIVLKTHRQITKFSLGNRLSTTHSYDSYGYLTAINTDQAVQSLSYNFERATGNLLSRSDNNYNLTEEFSYDENLLNSRLIQCKINGNISSLTSYQNNGNIDTKSDVGTYSYHSTKKHALETVVDPDPDFIDNSPLLQTSYTPFGKIRTIDQQNPGSPANPYHLNVYYGPDDQRIKTELYYGSTKIKTKLFGESGYEIISDNIGNKTQLHYLTSPSGIYAVFVKSNDADAIYFLHTDHLGSLYAITDKDGKIITQDGKEAIYSFDAWGRRRNPENWIYEGLPTAFLIDRGFTFHEHLDEFGLINMNGRVYDPVIGRFLSPDNYVQGGLTQSFNRYSYCQNNPLNSIDPSGNFAIVDSWIRGWFEGFFGKGGDLGNRLYNAMNKADEFAYNDLKITGGLFATDPNKNFGGRVWEIISRQTWQLPQTLGGWFTAQWTNTVQGKVNWVEYKYGATVVNADVDYLAVTQSNYIVGCNELEADANNPLFQHEYGHYIQSQSMGWAYYTRVGIPSGLSNGNHNLHPVEQDANRRAFLYFNENIENFQNDENYSSFNYKENKGWDFKSNPFIDGVGTPVSYNLLMLNYVNYQDNNDLNSLNKIKLHATWYDHASGLLWPDWGSVIMGILNAYNYNH